MIGAQSAYAETAYQSGFKHGVADGKIDLTVDRSDRTYIHQPGKGFAFHTTEFVNGYLHGFCLANHGGGIEANDDPEPTLASFDCDEGLSSAFPHPNDWPN
jgi:hypothetical protein